MQMLKINQSSWDAQLQKLATVCFVPATPLFIVFALVTYLIKKFQYDNLKLIHNIQVTVWI